MSPRDVTLIVIAKEPRPGRCKTRLCPPLDPAEAAGLAEAALADTLATVAAAPAARRLLVLDGRPGPWMPPGFDVVQQARGELGPRLAGAFSAASGAALLVGMDTPQLTVAALARATTALLADGVDAVLGPAPDGGYWSIGLRRPGPDVFAGVPMSAPSTGAAQLRRLQGLGLTTVVLEPMRDFDTIEDAIAVAARCPGSQFARRLASIPWSAAA